MRHFPVNIARKDNIFENKMSKFAWKGCMRHFFLGRKSLEIESGSKRAVGRGWIWWASKLEGGIFRWIERLTSASRPKRLVFFKKKKAEKGGCYITQRSIKIKSEPLGLSLSSRPKNPLNPRKKEKKYQLGRNNVWETVWRTKSNLPITFRSIQRKPSKKFPWPSLKGKEEEKKG